jgi:sugar (pentulose or hexulose) kinase
MQRALELLGISWSDLPHLDERALAAASGRVKVGGIGTEELRLAGIAGGVGPGEVWRAVVEAATAEAVRLHEAMTAVVGPHNRLIAAGGWCNSTMVLQAKTAGFGDVTIAAAAEAGTLGAATMAARAAGRLGPDDLLGVSA